MPTPEAMFQPQPTPYSASSFAPFPYGIGAAHGFDFLLHTGGGPSAGAAGAGTGAGAAGLGSGIGSGAGAGFLGLAGAGAASAATPVAGSSAGIALPLYQYCSPPASHPVLQHRRRLDRTGGPVIKMEDQDPGLHDMAAQQAAAEGFQPGHEGPFVGQKIPSDAITHEYAKADPVYVEKTIALPQTYSHYRQIKGDGNCGWRAIAFAYYEKLVDLGDQVRIEGEVARLMSLGHMISTVGGYEYHEDFAEEAHNLLRELAVNIANPGLARVILLQRFNDSSVEANIIYYFRILAATYLKVKADIYDDFAAEFGGIASYCSQSIDIVNREIEHLGIVGLANILLKPIGFVLEIAYLDRSAGSDVNRYRFPEEANQQELPNLGPTLYLLYRPDHYDILYRTPPVQRPAPSVLPVSVSPPSSPVDVQVNRVNFTSNIAIHSNPPGFGGGGMDVLAMLPGFGMNALGSMGDLGPLTSPPAAANSLGDPLLVPSEHSGPWMPQYPESLPSQVPPQQQQQLPPASLPPPPVVSAAPINSSTSMTPSPTLPMATRCSSGSGHPPPLVPAPQPTAPGYRIRFSPVQLDYEESKRINTREPPYQTTTSTTFKNSVWNRAHYGNPDFHPEEYVPDDEQDVRGGRPKAKRCNSGGRPQ